MKISFLLALVVCLGFLAYALWYHQENMPLPEPNTATVTLGGTTVTAEVADTPAAREQGLSGTAPLPEGSGMLFVFDAPGGYAFWMKDMNYSLDIIWADASGTITTIYPGLSPQTYPQAFAPSTPDALYVLEVPSGFAAAHDIKVGDTMRINANGHL